MARNAFWNVLELPVQEADTQEVTSEGGRAVAHANTNIVSFPPPHPKRTILVVDDYEPHRYALAHDLQRAGFAVLEAGTGKDAIAQAAQHPSLILLDVDLPDLSGFDVCRAVKANPETAGIPVVFVSAMYMNRDAVMAGESAGGSSFLFFPITANELLPVIEGSIARADRATA